MLNDFFKLGDFQRTLVNWTFDRTVFFITLFLPLIYAHLEIFVENILLLHPLVAMQATEMEAFCSFQLRCQACSFLDACRRSLLLLVTVIFDCRRPLGHSLGFSLPAMAFHLLNSASPAVVCHSESLTLPSRCRPSASYHFLVPPMAFLLVYFVFRHWPLTHSLQLVLAKVDFSSFQDVLQERHNKLLIALHKLWARPSTK